MTFKRCVTRAQADLSMLNLLLRLFQLMTICQWQSVSWTNTIRSSMLVGTRLISHGKSYGETLYPLVLDIVAAKQIQVPLRPSVFPDVSTMLY